MQRYFITPDRFGTDRVSVTGDDAHHLTRVMRAQVGDKFICSDGQNREALAEITQLGKDAVEAAIVELLPMTSEPAIQVWVAQSLPKGDKMETVIQKGTEIGATRFIPFISERTIVQYDERKESKRLERWHKIAKEAAEQAHRNRIPVIEPMHSWKQLLRRAGDVQLALVCYEKEGQLQLRELLRGALGRQSVEPSDQHCVLLIVGPEGGFTEKEIAEAEEAGIKSISLGKRILRTETAALVGVTCILYESGEMGG
ncbi:16S rRNA (uracil(1498)-N(3))-methyltransferase [Paenibacillus sp. MBLB4367]|uniref:16S rRNA (uracil(1498)-N(3))-methyltransferase n=1 Tax=Paenibacillus sp. MBLB4367 TaxID=3384767 RepID=UPI003907FEA9